MKYLRKLVFLFRSPKDKPILGRWKVKSCNEVTTTINSVFQNRDHCSDKICSMPKKAFDYIKK